MKRYVISYISVLIIILLFSSCSSEKNYVSDESEQAVLANKMSATGRFDGMIEDTYVYYNGVLYVRDWSKFSGVEDGNKETDGDFSTYSEKHTLRLLGEIQKVDNYNLPTENFAAYEAELGDKLYEDENGNIFLLRNYNNRLNALKVAD